MERNVFGARHPIERIPTEMFLEGETINTKIKQAQVFAKVFKDKIKDIVAECKIQEEVENGH